MVFDSNAFTIEWGSSEVGSQGYFDNKSACMFFSGNVYRLYIVPVDDLNEL